MMRSLCVRPRYWIIDSVLVMMFACEIMTPRGRPVDPEVNISAAKSSAFTVGNVALLPAERERTLAKLTARKADEPGNSRSTATKVLEKQAAFAAANPACKNATRASVIWRT